MARIRTVKPEFFSHETLASKSAHARLLAIGLLTLADCEGRLRWVPMQVHAQVFPWEASVKIEVLLGELIECGYVVHYEVDGKRYVEVVNFKKHQRLSGKELSYASRLPAPPVKEGGTDEKPNENKGETGEATGKHQDTSLGSSGNPLGTGEHRNKEHGNIGTEYSCTELAKQATVPTCSYPVFPCSGNTKSWTPPDSLVSAIAAAYPAIDVQLELRKAHVWIISNPTKRKTATGYAKYLNGWCSKAQNDSRSIPPARSEPERDRTPTKEDLLNWSPGG